MLSESSPPRPLSPSQQAELLRLGLREPSTWPPSPEALGESFSEFEVVSMLGQGAAGAVYRVRDPEGDEFALKVIRPDLLQQSGLAARFAREAEALEILQHPRIVKIHGFGERDGWFYLQMEYVSGQSLRTWMDSPMDPERALTIIDELCEGLAFAHDHGVIHRDIKPENVLLDHSGHVKLADFGLAKLRDADAQWTLTGSHMLLGTPLYLAPEQIHSPQAIDHRVDIYSVGVLLYEALTGRLPMGRVERPSAVARVSRRIDRIVMRALEPDPDRRFGDVEALRRALPNATSSGRHRWWIPAASAAAITVGVLASQPRTEPESFEGNPLAGALLQFGAARMWDGLAGPSGEPIEVAEPTPDSDAEVLWAAAEAARDAGRWSEARAAYDSFLEHHPTHRLAPRAFFYVGRMYFEEAEYKEAAKALYAFVQKHPKAARVGEALYYTGVSFAKMGHCSDARAYFQALDQRRFSKQLRDKVREQLDLLDTSCTEA